MSNIPSYLMLSRHSVYYFRIVVPDVIRPLFPQREIRRSLQTRCKREALIRGRDILAQVQGLFTLAFQGSRPSVELLRGAWEAGGKRLACWASWLRQQQLLGAAMPSPEVLRETPPVVAQLPAVPPSVIAKGALQQSPGFLAVVDEQLVHQRREGVAVKSLDDKRAVAVLLTRIIGDMPIDQITRKDAHLFRETALKLPPRLHQLPDQPLEQSIAEAASTIRWSPLRGGCSEMNQEWVLQLKRQIKFLRSSSVAYDQGDHAEAARIAVAIRVLCYDKPGSPSLLKHMGKQDTLQLVTTARSLPASIAANPLEFGDLLGGLIFGQAIHYDAIPQGTPTLAQPAWWSETVLIRDNVRYSRGDLVLTTAHKDGGAHVDKPNRRLKAFREGFWMKVHKNAAGEEIRESMGDTHFRMLRRFADELLHSPELLDLME